MPKIGQMSLAKQSNLADYIQLDISGLIAEEAWVKVQKYTENIPIILHGDWEKKKGQSENNIETRYIEYINIVKKLSLRHPILGITIHPPKRTKVTWENFLRCINEVNRYIPVFVENRSNPKLYVSLTEEVIQCSKTGQFLMTIDIPQLYIACGYDYTNFQATLEAINFKNVREIHLANLKKEGSHTYVGRKLTDGILNIASLEKYLNAVNFITLEILGGVSTFDCMSTYIKQL